MPVRGIGFKRLISVDEAINRFFGFGFNPVGEEVVPSTQALNRVLALDVTSRVDVPSFDRSAVDGYALKAEETFAASPMSPTPFRVVGGIDPGQISSVVVGKGKCVEIATGGRIPRGADAVVALEFAERAGDTLKVLKPVVPFENVAVSGEDVKRGQTVLRAGRVLRAQDLGLLASIGVGEIRVYARPRVGLISTGGELVEPFTEEEVLGKTVNTNRLMLQCLVGECCGVAVDYGIVQDDLDAIRNALKRALKETDIVVLTGGASVGGVDLVPEAIDSLGKPGTLVHGVAMRPGKPVGLAVVYGKPVISLPGFPVAALIDFDVFVRPLIRKMAGFPNEMRLKVRARLRRRISSKIGLRSFVRVRVEREDGRYVADPIRVTGSGMLSTMTRANGMVIVPEDRGGLEEGETVEVCLFTPFEVADG